MNLSRLLYISDPAYPIMGRELDALVAKSRSNNDAQEITGILLSSGGHFLQVLEGDAMRIQALYEHICSDPRHRNVQKLLFKGADKRLFPRWGMELLNACPWRPQNREWINRTLIRLRLGVCESEAQKAITLLHEFRKQFSAEAA